MVEITPGGEEDRAPFVVELAQVTPVFGGQLWGRGVRDSSAVPSAKDELALPKSAQGRDALALAAAIPHHDVGSRRKHMPSVSGTRQGGVASSEREVSPSGDRRSPRRMWWRRRPRRAAATLPQEARNAPERIAVEGRTYTLRADLYRDLMPGPAPTPRRGVGGTMFLQADVESNAPAGLRADRAWLTNGSDIWETVPQPLQTLTVDRRYHLSLGVHDGPVWDAGSKVDVILRFSTASGTYFVQRSGVSVIGAL
jgi:hypothetical protein